MPRIGRPAAARVAQRGGEAGRRSQARSATVARVPGNDHQVGVGQLGRVRSRTAPRRPGSAPSASRSVKLLISGSRITATRSVSALLAAGRRIATLSAPKATASPRRRGPDRAPRAARPAPAVRSARSSDARPGRQQRRLAAELVHDEPGDQRLVGGRRAAPACRTSTRTRRRGRCRRRRPPAASAARASPMLAMSVARRLISAGLPAPSQMTTSKRARRSASDVERGRRAARPSARGSDSADTSPIGWPTHDTWLERSLPGLSSTGFIAASGSTPAAAACIACARPISAPSRVTIEFSDMFCALNGATFTPERASQRQIPAVTTDLPASLVVPSDQQRAATTDHRPFLGETHAPWREGSTAAVSWLPDHRSPDPSNRTAAVVTSRSLPGDSGGTASDLHRLPALPSTYRASPSQDRPSVKQRAIDHDGRRTVSASRSDAVVDDAAW